jgi:hypothetical protein
MASGTNLMKPESQLATTSLLTCSSKMVAAEVEVNVEVAFLDQLKSGLMTNLKPVLAINKTDHSIRMVAVVD